MNSGSKISANLGRRTRTAATRTDGFGDHLAVHARARDNRKSMGGLLQHRTTAADLRDAPNRVPARRCLQSSSDGRLHADVRAHDDGAVAREPEVLGGVGGDVGGGYK